MFNLKTINMRTFFTTLMTVCLLIISFGASAQTTGSFNDSVSFQGQQRSLAVYVPVNYDPANAYQLMICLHGLGDTCTNYRDALINAFSWNTSMPNTIFVCPEAANKSSDFFDPLGGEAIIQKSIDYARQNYNIDTNNIILQGFSLGGRAALRYGLDNHATFKGLLLNTPAVQGVKEAINEGIYNFNYQNAGEIPIYITWGNTDLAYEAPIDSAFEQLVLNNGKVKYLQIPNMGHTIPSNPLMGDFISYFNNPSENGLDLDVVKIYAPLRSCALQVSGAEALVRNTGNDTLHAATFDYSVNGTTQTLSWTGALAPFEHALVSLPPVNVSGGNASLQITADTLEGNVADTFINNNSKTASVVVQSQGLSLPFSEDFESGNFPNTNWTLNPAGDFWSAWAWDNTVAQSGAASMASVNTIFFFDNLGRKDDVATPLLDLSSLPNPFLKFDVAYNFHRYTPPYFTAIVDFADTLEVLITTDCGNSYTSLYKRGGADLATFSVPIINPLTINDLFIFPADSNWRTEQIDLSSYASNTQASLLFRYTSALGGCINIDNVRVSNTLGVNDPAQRETAISVYPNPAKDDLHISATDPIVKVSILDMTGKTIKVYSNNSGSKNMTLNTVQLADGVYMLSVTTGTATQNKKIVIRR